MNSFAIQLNGCISLDEDILAHPGVKPGDQVVLAKLPGGRIEIRVARTVSAISDVFGLLRTDNGPVLSIDEINEAIAEGWSGAGENPRLE